MSSRGRRRVLPSPFFLLRVRRTGVAPLAMHVLVVLVSHEVAEECDDDGDDGGEGEKGATKVGGALLLRNCACAFVHVRV